MHRQSPRPESSYGNNKRNSLPLPFLCHDILYALKCARCLASFVELFVFIAGLLRSQQPYNLKVALFVSIEGCRDLYFCLVCYLCLLCFRRKVSEVLVQLSTAVSIKSHQPHEATYLFVELLFQALEF